MHVFNAMLYIALAVASIYQQSSTFEWNKKSTLSTDHQVEFPGIVLEPGTYVVRLRDGGERRSVVEIRNQDETQVLATVVAVPDHRVRPEENSEFTFHQVKSGGPVPVQTWFYTGDLVGLEFVYPKARANEIAKESGEYVVASDGKLVASDGNKDAAIVAVTPNGKEIVIDGQATQTARQKPR